MSMIVLDEKKYWEVGVKQKLEDKPWGLIFS